MFRTIVCCAILSLGLSLNAIAAPVCDDAECQTTTKAKPLNIMQFMREQAASTRVATSRQSGTTKPRQSKAQSVAHKAPSVAHGQRPARRAVAAGPKPSGLPTEAATSYAAQQPPVQVVASDELNDIDRKAEELLRQSALARMADAEANTKVAQPSAAQTNVSWLRWIWSGVANTFAALATAAHHLVGA